MSDDNRPISSFLVLCDKSLSKEARNIRKLVADCESGEFIIQTVQQVPLVMDYNQFQDKLKHVLTTWSEAVIVLTSTNFAAYIDRGETGNLPDLLEENHPQSHQVLRDFFINDGRQIRSKIIAIKVNGDGALPQCLAHVQPIEKDADKNVFANRIRGLITAIANAGQH